MASAKKRRRPRPAAVGRFQLTAARTNSAASVSDRLPSQHGKRHSFTKFARICNPRLMCSERRRRDRTGPSGGNGPDRAPAELLVHERSTPRLATLILAFTIVLFVAPAHARPAEGRTDTLCNVGGTHECVCNRSAGNLDGTQHCDQIFEEKTLPVIRIVMRNVNLNARLYTNETYQDYFRRRIANLVSKYCEHQANECPGTALRLTKVDSSEPQLMDEIEPLIAQENVVLLRVIYPDRGRTEVFFVVLKNVTTKEKIGKDDILENQLVKSVLSVQLAPLSRVLGGIRIEKLEETTIKRQRPPSDNTKLLTMIGIVVACMVPCYVIATWRVCREHYRKKKAQENLSDKNKRNYGTCTDKFLPICEVPNGKPKTKSITSDGSVKSKKSKANAAPLALEVVPMETEPLQEREEPAAYERMFMCDPSQLPDESILTEEVEPGESIGSPSENIEMDETSEASPSTLPSVVLVQSNSHVEIANEKNNNKRQAGSAFLGGPANIPYERPLSRRGSRVSTPEQGEEYTDTREDTPQPLGDDVFDSPKEAPAAVTIAINDTAVARSSTAHKFSHWSSDSEPEPNEVYQKLDESDEDEAALSKQKKNKKTTTKKSSPRNRERSLHSESSESDNEDVLDRHQYERLQESPLPPANAKQPPIALDSTLQYNHDSLNHSDT